jgi:hypothetical protein
VSEAVGVPTIGSGLPAPRSGATLYSADVAVVEPKYKKLDGAQGRCETARHFARSNGASDRHKLQNRCDQEPWLHRSQSNDGRDHFFGDAKYLRRFDL